MQRYEKIFFNALKSNFLLSRKVRKGNDVETNRLLWFPPLAADKEHQNDFLKID